MKKIVSLILACVALAATAAPLAAQQKRTSPHESIYVRLGVRPNVTLVSVTYGRPYTKDPKTGEARKIWGGLVAWDKADRLGSDEATLLLTQRALVIGDVTVPAGAHTLYIIPSATGPSKLGTADMQHPYYTDQSRREADKQHRCTAMPQLYQGTASPQQCNSKTEKESST